MKSLFAAKLLSLLVVSLLWCTQEAQAQKFAYVDSKYILSHMPEYQQAQAEINKLSEKWQKEIEAKYENIERLEKALQAEKILLTEEMRKKREQEIETKRQDVKDMQKKKFGVQGELFQKREELIQPIQEKIYTAIQEVSSASSLMVVFDKANGSGMLYTNPKHDISDKVLRKMGYKPGDTIEEEGGGEEGGDEKDAEQGGASPAPKGDGSKGARPGTTEKK
jgi:outer membrane protein